MNANELYFTRQTKRAQRLGDTLVVVTEGARVTITLQDDGQPAKVTVAKAKPAAQATPATPAKRQSNVARRKEVLTRATAAKANATAVRGMRAQARAAR